MKKSISSKTLTLSWHNKLGTETSFLLLVSCLCSQNCSYLLLQTYHLFVDFRYKFGLKCTFLA